MSFSSEVKEELSRHIPVARHCQIAEAAAIFRMCGQSVRTGSGGIGIRARIENPAVASTFASLLRRGFGITPAVSVRGEVHLVEVQDPEAALHVLRAMKLLNEKGEEDPREDFISAMVVQNSCCKRAFIRGAFLAGGSISNPEKSYHLEIVCVDQAKADQLVRLMAAFEVEAKTVLRKRYHVVYIKEGSQIVDMLGIMEAHVALMNLENVRILKEMRGTVNRKVNCETANINKTVSAAVEQINDILYIRDQAGFDRLPAGLKEIALARLEQPDATLKELGDSLDPPVGKSGVNHRLRKLREIATQLREHEEEEL